MVNLVTRPMYLTDHLNTWPVHKKSRWSPFVWYSNGRAVRHMASNLFSTIWISNLFSIQIPTVFYSWLLYMPCNHLSLFLSFFPQFPFLSIACLCFPLYFFFSYRVIWKPLNSCYSKCVELSCNILHFLSRHPTNNKGEPIPLFLRSVEELFPRLCASNWDECSSWSLRSKVEFLRHDPVRIWWSPSKSKVWRVQLPRSRTEPRDWRRCFSCDDFDSP